MKKINILVITLVFIICYVVLRNVNLSLSPQILPRKVIIAPLEGTWVANKYLFVGNSSFSEKDAKELLGKKVVFDREEVYFNNSICKTPNFKVKLVNTKSYFWNKFRIKSSDIGVSEKNVKVITVSSNDSFFDEYIQISDTHIMKDIDGMLVFFRKQGAGNNETSLDKFDETNSKLVMSSFQKDVISKSGVLLGLRYKNDDKGYSYRTLWISCNYGNIASKMEMNDLLVPRKNGFWKIGVEKKIENSVERNILWGVPVNKDPKNPKYLNKKQFALGDTEFNIQNNLAYNNVILFVGNEYVSLDCQGLDPNTNNNSQNHFEVLPIDKLSGNKVEFSKAFGAEAGGALKTSAQLYLRRLKDSRETDDKDLQTNWAVIRRGGRWTLRGRIPQGDFDIAFDTPKILTTYDELFPPFNEIKKKVPDAVDAYTSPNKDFLVILTKTDLKIFSINNNEIGTEKMDVKLNSEEQVVMSQWATGNYVDEWAKLFGKM